MHSTIFYQNAHPVVFKKNNFRPYSIICQKIRLLKFLMLMGLLGLPKLSKSLKFKKTLLLHNTPYRISKTIFAPQIFYFLKIFSNKKY